MRITNDQRGLLFRHGNYVRHLKPGRYFRLPARQIVTMDVTRPFQPAGKDLNLFLGDSELLKELAVVQVREYEYALHLEDGMLTEVLRPGRYAYWTVLKKHEFIMVDTRQPEIDPALVPMLVNPKGLSCMSVHDVAGHETGILFYNNVLQKRLEPGRYFFWLGSVAVTVVKVDLRRQQIDMTGQEIMTADKVALRLNFYCQYRITDPSKVIQIKAHEEQLYIVLQLILREYVGSLRFDELLAQKQEIGDFVLGRLKEKGAEFGVEFLSAGVKDIILPGEIREIINTVLIAEKQAQANVISRREEVASTRSLLNTARLMEENQTLYRLKELEFLEKICDRIGNISLMGGGNLLEQLNALLETNKKNG